MGTRRYNTSCGACRRSRIGCDAVAQRPKACTNCVRRGKMCESAGRSRRSTAEQGRRSRENVDYSVTDAGRDATTPFSRQLAFRSETPSPLNSPSLPIIEFENIATKRAQWSQLHRTLWGIFHSVWDSRAGLWLGNSCNPFLEASVGTNSLMSRIVLEVDRSLGESGIGVGKNGSPEVNSSEDVALSDCLRYAVYAYAARWLPFRTAFQTKHDTSDEEAQKMEREVRSYFWRRARSSMYTAMTRPCYRSILALFLFCFTEMPVDNDDPGFDHLCCEMLFSHVNHMRSSSIRQKRWGALSEYTTVTPQTPGGRTSMSAGFDHLRISMFWLAVICDSTRSILQLSPSVILPGRSGDAKVWDLIRQRNIIFNKSFRSLHGSTVSLSDDVVNVVLQHTVACKTMHVGMLNQFFDAIFHNKTVPESVDAAAQRVLDESNRFHDSLNDLLTLCARDYSTMTVGNKLTYILALAHYHLGTLVLCDVCDTLDTVPEPLKDPKLTRLYATNAIVNAVSLALNYDRYVESDSPYSSILLRDPTPITMVEAMSRTAKAVFSLLEADKITSSTAQMMVSVVVSALTSLSQISESASFALISISGGCTKSQLRFPSKTSSPYISRRIDSDELELLSQCDGVFLDDFFQEMKIVDAGTSNLLLEQTIEKHEESLELSSVY